VPRSRNWQSMPLAPRICEFLGCLLSLTSTAAASSLVSASPAADIPPMSFESNLKRLEEIVAQLEGDRLDLNAALKLFEEGIELLRLASGELAQTESKVKELVERTDGVLELRDLRT